jgi:hypothetical protein
MAMRLFDGTAARYADELTAVLTEIAGKPLIPPSTPSDFRYDADTYADNIESMLALGNRFDPASMATWLNGMIGSVPVNAYYMYKEQEPSENGFVDRHYADGSFGRTCVLYASRLSRGVRPVPWRADLRLAATEMEGGGLHLFVAADSAWTGTLVFDTARHQAAMGMAASYPRINEFPEWFTAAPDISYRVTGLGAGPATAGGAELAAGLALSLAAGESVFMEIAPAPDPTRTVLLVR